MLLAKQQVFNRPTVQYAGPVIPVYRQVLAHLFAPSFQRTFAYAFGALFIILVGAFGWVTYNSHVPSKVAQETVTAVDQKEVAMIKTNVEEFKVKSQIFAKVVQDKKTPENVSVALTVRIPMFLHIVGMWKSSHMRWAM